VSANYQVATVAMSSKTEFQEKLDTAWEEVTEKDNSEEIKKIYIF
jgi:hypothetical protein